MSSKVYQRDASHVQFDEQGWHAVQNDINRVFSGLRQVTTDLAGFDPELKELTAAEIQQLQNIDTTTISTTQWSYVGAMDQGVATTDTPSFTGMTLTGNLEMGGQTITASGSPIVTVNTTSLDVFSELDMNTNRISRVTDLYLTGDGAEIGIQSNELFKFNTAGTIEVSGANFDLGGNDIIGLGTGGSINWDAGVHIGMPVNSILTYTADGSHAFVGDVTMDGSLLLTKTTGLVMQLGTIGDPVTGNAFVMYGNDATNTVFYVSQANAAGWGIYVTGSGRNYLDGSLGVNIVPVYTLDVGGNARINGGAANALYALNNSAASATVFAAQAHASGFAIYATGFKNYFAGDVGIGDLTPSYKLDVNGTFRAVGAGQFDSTVTLLGDSQSLLWGAASDMDMGYTGVYGYIRTDLVAASDLQIDCGTDKTVELVVPVWEDVQFHMSTGALRGANQPTWSALTTNTYAYQFAVDDIIDLEAQELNHKWKVGGTGHFHVHLVLDAASAGATRYAKFEVYVAYPDGTTGVYGETTLTGELTIPASSSAKKEFFLDVGDVTFTDRALDTEVVVSFKRIAATTGTDYADEIFALQCGCHIEQDTLGSRQENAK